MDPWAYQSLQARYQILQDEKEYVVQKLISSQGKHREYVERSQNARTHCQENLRQEKVRHAEIEHELDAIRRDHTQLQVEYEQLKSRSQHERTLYENAIESLASNGGSHADLRMAGSLTKEQQVTRKSESGQTVVIYSQRGEISADETPQPGKAFKNHHTGKRRKICSNPDGGSQMASEMASHQNYTP